MAYQAIVLPTAETDLESLHPKIRESVVRKIAWLAQNAEAIIHHPLHGMPADLEGLCRLHLGDYRILYWKYPAEKLIKVYRVQHRSEVYRTL